MVYRPKYCLNNLNVSLMNMDIKENVGLKKLRKGVRDVIKKTTHNAL